MKKKTNIRQVIRKIVREEVALAIGEVVTELKQPSLSSKKVSKSKQKKTAFTKNPILNEILNETANEDWPTMGDGIYDTSRTSEVLSKQYNRENPDNPNGSLGVEMGVNPEAPGMEFLKKDYRSIMKKVDSKRGK